MPFDHVGNNKNGNALKKIASTGSYLQGRTTSLPIYEIRLGDLQSEAVSGDSLITVIQSIVKNDTQDLAKGYRQPTNHDDRLGNLPAAPGNGVTYREYFLKNNKFPMSGFVRLVADLKNKRMFITPTHYDIWLTDNNLASHANTQNEIASTTAGACNPFFLLSGLGAWNNCFY